MAMMLALARRVLPGHQGVVDASYRKRGLEPATTSEWHFSFNWLGFTNVTELAGKTLGLVGLGEIGREVARRARAFDMRILYHQRHPIHEKYEKILGICHVPLERLLRESDFVSLHVPLTEQTRGLLDQRRIASMKPGAVLINTARGELVDESALVEALESGHLGGAGLDAFSPEPPAPGPLWEMEQVVLTPHLGGNTREAALRTALQSARNAVAILTGNVGQADSVANPEVLNTSEDDR
jgi:phosphoglycerate dehydrogenase-like enzyme